MIPCNGVNILFIVFRDLTDTLITIYVRTSWRLLIVYNESMQTFTRA